MDSKPSVPEPAPSAFEVAFLAHNAKYGVTLASLRGGWIGSLVKEREWFAIGAASTAQELEILREQTPALIQERIQLKADLEEARAKLAASAPHPVADAALREKIARLLFVAEISADRLQGHGALTADSHLIGKIIAYKEVLALIDAQTEGKPK